MGSTHNRYRAGSKNYQSFFVLVTTILFQVLAQMTAGSFLLWWAVTKPDVAEEVLESSRYPEALHRDSFVAALAVYLVRGCKQLLYFPSLTLSF
jgi:hypothetical protein